jgi:hypothetical protein
MPFNPNQKTFYEFEVMGKGVFPIDMLRHDQCFPMGPEDSANMENPYEAVERFGDVRHVRLCAVSHPNFKPTEGRWASFGWPVVRDSFKVV